MHTSCFAKLSGSPSYHDPFATTSSVALKAGIYDNNKVHGFYTDMDDFNREENRPNLGEQMV